MSASVVDQAAPVAIPTLATVHPPWKVASDRLAALQAERDAVHAYGKLLQSDQDAATQASGNRSSLPVPLPPLPQPKPLSADVTALLGDLAPPAPAPVPPPDQQPVRFADDLTRRTYEYSRQCVALNEAIRIAQECVESEYRIGSRKLAAAVAPHYREVAAKVSSALVALASAWQEEQDFRHYLVLGGSGFGQLPMLAPDYFTELAGNIHDSTSPLRRALNWAAECGYYNLADLPQRFKSAPAAASSPPSPTIAPAKRLKLMGQSFVRMLSPAELKDGES